MLHLCCFIHLIGNLGELFWCWHPAVWKWRARPRQTDHVIFGSAQRCDIPDWSKNRRAVAASASTAMISVWRDTESFPATPAASPFSAFCPVTLPTHQVQSPAGRERRGGSIPWVIGALISQDVWQRAQTSAFDIFPIPVPVWHAGR